MPGVLVLCDAEVKVGQCLYWGLRFGLRRCSGVPACHMMDLRSCVIHACGEEASMCALACASHGALLLLDWKAEARQQVCAWPRVP